MPLVLQIEGFNSEKVSHCGVLEFCAEEGFVYMPRWMMVNLNVEDGDKVIMCDAQPSRGTLMRLQPHKAAFLEVSNVRAVLETALRGFSCLSLGDTIMVRYNGEEFYIDVLNVGPGGEVISLIETDCIVEFAPPLDYVEPPQREVERDGDDRLQKKSDGVGEEREGVKEFLPFTGRAMRLDGEAVVVESGQGCSTAAEGGKRREDGGKLDVKVKQVGGESEGVREFLPFAGVARRLDGSGGCSALEGCPGGTVAEAEERREKDGGKDEGREKFKAFAGRGRVLGGPSSD